MRKDGVFRQRCACRIFVIESINFQLQNDREQRAENEGAQWSATF